MAIDYNPDKERHVGHKWFVQKAVPDAPDSVEVDGKEYKFGREGWMRVSEEGVANAIRQKYGQDGTMAVSRCRWPHPADRGHNYVFTVPEMPWHKKEKENGS